MNRFCLGYRHCLYGGSLFFAKENVHDRLEDPPEFVPKTGLERVRKVFASPRPGEPSKELISLVQFAGVSAIVGFTVGGMKSGSRAHGNFMISNQHTKFISPYEARRKLHDTVFLAFYKGGVPWALKVFLFTSIYSLCTIIIPAYRNKEGVLEYFIGGALAGAVFRLFLGIKATLAGGIIGGVFASVIGILVFLSSSSMSEIRDMQYSLYIWRRNLIEEKIREVKEADRGNEFSSFLKFRELRRKSPDTDGYSTTESVYVIIPDPDDVNSSSEPTKNAIEVETSDELSSNPISVPGTEPESTNK